MYVPRITGAEYLDSIRNLIKVYHVKLKKYLEEYLELINDRILKNGS